MAAAARLVGAQVIGADDRAVLFGDERGMSRGAAWMTFLSVVVAGSVLAAAGDVSPDHPGRAMGLVAASGAVVCIAVWWAMHALRTHR